MLNTQEVFLEDAGHIHLEYFINHRPFLILMILFFFEILQGQKLTGVSSSTVASKA
jgi:hypothetical protein